MQSLNRRRNKLWMAVALVPFASAGYAADGTWTSTTSNPWSTAGSWTGNVVADGATFTASFSANITATTTITLDTPRTIGGLAFTDTNTATAATWVVSGANTLTLDADGAGGGTSMINVAAGSSATVGGASLVLAGTSAVSKTNTGLLTLTGSNTFSGPLSVLGGTLLVGSAAPSGTAGALGNATSAVLLGDTTGSNSITFGTVAAAANLTIARNLIVQANANTTVRIAQGGSSDGKSYIYSGTLTLGSGGIGHGVTLGGTSSAFGSSVTNTFSGVIQDPTGLSGTAGAVTIDGITGGNQFLTFTRLSGNNTFSGGVKLNGGYLSLDNNHALGTGTLIVSGNGYLDATSNATALADNNAIVLNGSLVFSNGFNSPTLNLGTGKVTVNTGGGNFNLLGGTSQTVSMTVGGVIANGTNVAALSFSSSNGAPNGGTASLTFNGLNTFASGFAINDVGGNGVFNIGNLGSATASALGTGTFTINGGSNTTSVRIDNTYGDGTLATNNAIVLNKDLTFVGTNNLNIGTGAVSLGTAAVASRTITVGSTGSRTLTIGGVISNGTNGTTPTKGLTKAGGGVLALTATNLYSGATSISAGTLAISAAGNLGDGSATNVINMSGGVLDSTSGTYDLGSNRAITLTGGAAIQADAGTLTVSGNITNGANLLTVQGAGNITLNGVLGSGAGGLTKLGTGSLTLRNADTFTGVTTGGGGTLKLVDGGTATGASGVTLSGLGMVLLDNSGSTNSADRLGAVAVTSSLGGGTFRFLGANGAGSTETVGALTPSSGTLIVDSTPGSGGGSTNALTFASVGTRAAGAVVVFSGANLGTDGTNKVVLTSAPTLSNHLVGGWATLGNEFATYNEDGLGNANSNGVQAAQISNSTFGASNNVKLTAGTSLGTAASSLNLQTSSGQTFDLSGGTLTVNAGATNIGGLLVSNSGSGTDTLTNGSLGNAGELVVTTNSDLTLDGTALLAGNGVLTKSGSGTLALNAANTTATRRTTANTYIDAGVLKLGGQNVLYDTTSVAAKGTIIVQANATLDLAGAINFTSTTNASPAITLNDNGANLRVEGGNAVTYARGSSAFSVTAAKAVSLDAIASSDSLTFTAGFGGGGTGTMINVNPTGAGTVALNTSMSTFVTSWTLAGGKLLAGSGANNNPLGQSGNAIAVSGGTLGLANDFTGTYNYTLSGGTLSGAGGGTRTISTASTITLAPSMTSTIDLKDAAAGATANMNVSFAGVIRGTGNLNVAASGSGAGVLALSGANTYLGSTTVTAGTLQVLSTGRLGRGAAASVHVLSGAALELDSFSTIDDAAGLTLDTSSTAFLNYTGSEVVSSLVLGGIVQSMGTYGHSGSGAQFINDTFFTGTGVIAVPEPSAVAGLVLGGLLALRRRRRAQV